MSPQKRSKLWISFRWEQVRLEYFISNRSDNSFDSCGGISFLRESFNHNSIFWGNTSWSKRLLITIWSVCNRDGMEVNETITGISFLSVISKSPIFFAKSLLCVARPLHSANPRCYHRFGQKADCPATSLQQTGHQRDHSGELGQRASFRPSASGLGKTASAGGFQ